MLWGTVITARRVEYGLVADTPHPGDLMRISKTFSVDAAHCLALPYESKCRNLHGHTYRITLTMEGAAIPGTGMVADYTRFPKDVVMQLDHKMLVAQKHVRPLPGESSTMAHAIIGPHSLVLGHESVFIMPGIENTTAEEIARYLYEKLVQVNHLIVSVSVSETEATTAVYP